MSKIKRRIVHELAGAYKLKSNSTGGGERRFTTLRRTTTVERHTYRHTDVLAVLKRSRWVDQAGIDLERISSRPVKTNFSRSKIKNVAKDMGHGRRHREGDVVAADAPEIAFDNRGRAMLEKMGWANGMGLGSTSSNTSIQQPIMAIIKTTKLGLGS